MTVYVDTIVKYPGARPPFHHGSCHMTADTLDELHAMADRIGLKRAWFQNHPLAAHYDLTPSRRVAAVAAGAVQETSLEGARRRRSLRNEIGLIHDRIDAWHESDRAIDICAWLGWTPDEYAAFVDGRAS